MNNGDFPNNLGGTNNGLIFVWDLDQTLINVTDKVHINTEALKIMNTAFDSGKLTANLMLTNNGNEGFIRAAQIELRDKYNQMFSKSQRRFLFNLTYNANTQKRVPDMTVPENSRTPGHKAKCLQDVINMLNQLGLPTDSDSLSSRVFFFDDLDHVIRTEIPEENYIQITPPFIKEDDTNHKTDKTNYKPVLSALAALRQSGGASKKHTRKSKRSKSKKYKKHKKLTTRARVKQVQTKS